MPSATPRIWPVVIAAAAAFAFLTTLGVWQVRRLAEKEAQIAALEARLASPAVSLSEVLTQAEQGADIEFLKVNLSGQIDIAAERYKIATNKGSAAWQVLTPMLTDDGIFVLLDRGLVPENLKAITAPGSSPTSVQNLSAIVRLHQGGQGFFDPENDVAGNRWYWWDIPTMLSSVNVPADVKVAPFIVQRLPSANDPPLPEAAIPKANLRNNHLGYAITWFGLALVTLMMAGAYVASLLRTRKA